MLVSTSSLLDAMRRNRCVKSARILGGGEILLSQAAMPGLYSGKEEKREQRYVLELLDTLVAVLNSPDTTIVERSTIRAFMEKVIAHGAMGREDYVHRFIFEFWDSIWSDDFDRISFDEKYMWGHLGSTHSTEFSTSVLPLIRDDRSYPDIIGRGGRGGRDIIVVDVKLSALDDRAVGQMIRYYGLARRTVDYHRHGCDLRRVVPVVIVAESKQTKYWEAVPEHFREFLVVCFYRAASDGRILLHDARKELLSWTKQERFASMST